MRIELSQYDLCNLLINKINKHGSTKTLNKEGSDSLTTSAIYHHPSFSLEDGGYRPQLSTTVEFINNVDTFSFKLSTLNNLTGRIENVQGILDIVKDQWLSGLNNHFVDGDKLFQQMFIELLTSDTRGWRVRNDWLSLYYDENYVCF